jgi:hypothetical protein
VLFFRAAARGRVVAVVVVLLPDVMVLLFWDAAVEVETVAESMRLEVSPRILLKEDRR